MVFTPPNYSFFPPGPQLDANCKVQSAAREDRYRGMWLLLGKPGWRLETKLRN